MTIYTLDVLLSQFGASPLFHVQSNCCFLTCIQVSQEAGKVVWYSHLFKNFPQFLMIHTVRGFRLVNEAGVEVFLEFSCFFCDPTNVGTLISGSSVFSKPSLYIWKFTYYWSLAWRIWCVTLLACEMSATDLNWIWWSEHSLALPCFVVGMKTDLFYPVASAEFYKFADILTAAL